MAEIDRAFIDMVVKMVLEKLNGSKKALVIFCGGRMGLEEGLKEICRLSSDGFDLQAALSPAAENLLGADNIRSRLGNVPVFTEKNGRMPMEIIREKDVIIVPMLTLNSAAKIAHGIADNLVTNLIMMGLFSGIPVVAAKDGCDIENLAQKKIYPSINNRFHKNIFNENLKTLEKIGIVLAPARNLEEKVLNTVKRGNTDRPESSGTETGAKKAAGPGENIKRQVLTTGDLNQLTDSILKVDGNTLITPAARDLARERGIDIILT